MLIGTPALVGISWLLVSIVFNTVIQVWCDQIPVEYDPKFQIWDLFFEIIPHSLPHWVPDVWLFTLYGLAAIRWLLIPLPGFVRPMTVATRYIYALGAMYFMRGLSLGTTRLPRILPAGAMQHLGLGWGLWGFLSGSHPTQSDFMFSGHTGSMVLLGLFMTYYTHHSVFSMMYWVLVLGGWWAIIAARTHYSSDIIMAILVVLLTFALFHALADTEWLGAWRSNLGIDLSTRATITLPASLVDARGERIDIVDPLTPNGTREIRVGWNSSRERRRFFRMFRWLISGGTM